MLVLSIIEPLMSLSINNNDKKKKAKKFFLTNGDLSTYFLNATLEKDSSFLGNIEKLICRKITIRDTANEIS